MFSGISSFFFPPSKSTNKPGAGFTSVAASSAGLPAAAAPILKKNSKVNGTRSSSVPSFPSFSSNLKPGINYADPSSEEEYALKISKPKFNAGDPNPFFVNVPAKKYKVLVSDDLEVEPTEEITNATLRFYGSSAENVYKKAKTYKTSAKSKHNTLFQKARENHRTRAIKNIRNKAQAGRQSSKQTNLQMQKFRQRIQKITLELNDYLEKYALAKKGYIPATAFKKSSTMTPEVQKREINRLEGLMKTAVSLLNEIKGEIEKVPNLPIDIQTSLEKALSQGAKAEAIAKSPPNPMWGHSASTQRSAGAATQGTAGTVGQGTAGTAGQGTAGAATQGTAGTAGQGIAGAAALLKQSGYVARRARSRSANSGNRSSAADVARRGSAPNKVSAAAGNGDGAGGPTVRAPAGTGLPIGNGEGAGGPTVPASAGKGAGAGSAGASFLNPLGKTIAPVLESNSAREAQEIMNRVRGMPTLENTSPVPGAAGAAAETATVPKPVAAAAPPAPGTAGAPVRTTANGVPIVEGGEPWTGGSRKRRHQKKRKARTAKRKTGKSRKY